MKFLLGLMIGLLIVPLIGYIYLTGSSAPVGTSDKPMPFETYFAKRALHTRIEAQMPKTVPIQADEANYAAGAQLYKENCAVCHGLPGQQKTAIAAGEFPKPAIVEMGGKNPALVMPSADLAQAVQGIYRSAFGMNGHKCSACSRVYVHRAVADQLLAGLVKAADGVVPADPLEKGTFVGPVATKQSYEDYQRYAALARQAGDAVKAGGAVLTDGAYAHGYFVRPTVLAGLPRDHQLVRDELFVPIVVVETVDSLDEALARANDTKFGLTAGFFSREQKEIDAFFDRIEAGVTYVNRAAGATTGAWPGVQPFGGWKGSGSTGKNIGGLYTVPCYLREQSRTVCQ